MTHLVATSDVSVWSPRPLRQWILWQWWWWQARQSHNNRIVCHVHGSIGKTKSRRKTSQEQLEVFFCSHMQNCLPGRKGIPSYLKTNDNVCDDTELLLNAVRDRAD